jgi:hypothetical protein
MRRENFKVKEITTREEQNEYQGKVFFFFSVTFEQSESVYTYIFPETQDNPLPFKVGDVLNFEEYEKGGDLRFNKVENLSAAAVPSGNYYNSEQKYEVDVRRLEQEMVRHDGHNRLEILKTSSEAALRLTRSPEAFLEQVGLIFERLNKIYYDEK